jgi:hypothetical protein
MEPASSSDAGFFLAAEGWDRGQRSFEPDIEASRIVRDQDAGTAQPVAGGDA